MNIFEKFMWLKAGTLTNHKNNIMDGGKNVQVVHLLVYSFLLDTLKGPASTGDRTVCYALLLLFGVFCTSAARRTEFASFPTLEDDTVVARVLIFFLNCLFAERTSSGTSCRA